ncbi:hypothetical protein SLA2020_164840 [Shorea laevis]
MASSSFPFGLLLLLLLSLQSARTTGLPSDCGPISASDKDRIEFAQNLEFLEAEFFLRGSMGKGLDSFDPQLAKNGPEPIGARKANLDPLTFRIIQEFGYQEIGHLRAIVDEVDGIQRPLLDLSPEVFATIFNKAVGYTLNPPFDPYANSLNFLLGCYVIPYEGLVGYEGTIPSLQYYSSRRLVSGLLGVESGQDAVIRTLLYERAEEKVPPYNITVAELTNKISVLRNQLAMCGVKDEGLIVPLFLGAENLTDSNILSANAYSISYARNPQEILRTVYGSGSEYIPGGFYPHGANGEIARRYLGNRTV